MNPISCRRLYARLVLGAAAAVLATSSWAQVPVKIIVGYAAGGPLDAVARALADKIKEPLGTPVVVENRPGGSLLISLNAVKTAAPDGRTLFLGPSNPFVLFPYTMKNPGFDADKDFIPVALVASFPQALYTSVEAPYKTGGEYMAWIKAHPEKATIGVAALGGSQHMSILSMSKATGVDIELAAYKGGAPMVADILGQHLPAAYDAIGSVLEQQHAGKIRVLGISGEERSRLAPGVPTLLEQGIKGSELANGWYGVFAPAHTPAPVLQKLEAALIAAANDPETQRRMAQYGIDTRPMSSAQVRERIQQERVAWKDVVQKSGWVPE